MESEGQLVIVYYVRSGGGVPGSVRVPVVMLAGHRELEVIGKSLTEGKTHVDNTIVRHFLVRQASGGVTRQRILETGGKGPSIRRGDKVEVKTESDFGLFREIHFRAVVKVRY
jgi:hypothetical protein